GCVYLFALKRVFCVCVDGAKLPGVWDGSADGADSMTMKKRNRVLAIDDEPSMIEWLKILLEHEGYEVRTAMIGTRGEDIFKTWKPDVVVTDMMLPDADG